MGRTWADAEYIPSASLYNMTTSCRADWSYAWPSPRAAGKLFAFGSAVAIVFAPDVTAAGGTKTTATAQPKANSLRAAVADHGTAMMGDDNVGHSKVAFGQRLVVTAVSPDVTAKPRRLIRFPPCLAKRTAAAIVQVPIAATAAMGTTIYGQWQRRSLPYGGLAHDDPIN